MIGFGKPKIKGPQGGSFGYTGPERRDLYKLSPIWQQSEKTKESENNLENYLKEFGQGDPKSDERSQKLNDLLQQFLNYQTPETDINRQTNILGQMLAAEQSKQQRNLQGQTAARTGGRVSTSRGSEDIAGQFALAKAQGTSNILNQAAQNEMAFKQQALNSILNKYINDQNRDLSMKTSMLQAYVSKYGIDTNALIAMQQLKAQKEAQDDQILGGLLGGIINIGGALLTGGASLPFTMAATSGGGNVPSDDDWYNWATGG